MQVRKVSRLRAAPCCQLPSLPPALSTRKLVRRPRGLPTTLGTPQHASLLFPFLSLNRCGTSSSRCTPTWRRGRTTPGWTWTTTARTRTTTAAAVRQPHAPADASRSFSRGAWPPLPFLGGIVAAGAGVLRRADGAGGEEGRAGGAGGNVPVVTLDHDDSNGGGGGGGAAVAKSQRASQRQHAVVAAEPAQARRRLVMDVDESDDGAEPAPPPTGPGSGAAAGQAAGARQRQPQVRVVLPLNEKPLLWYETKELKQGHVRVVHAGAGGVGPPG